MSGSERETLIRELVDQARELDAADRIAFLDKTCANDSQLRAEIKSRLLSKANGADRNLLLGITALQLNFIDRNDLIEAMHGWVREKQTPLENLLVNKGALKPDARELLTAIVDKHLEYCGNDVAKSLATFSTVDVVANDLLGISDPDLQQSLGILSSPKSSPTTTQNPSTLPLTDDDGHGRFRILRPHQEGGLGQISVALDKELNRHVALKEVRPEYASQTSAQERLRIEAEITGGLEHPGIVPVYALGTHSGGQPFYCMRFIRGDSLKEAIRSFHKQKTQMTSVELNLATRSLMRRFVDVCDAISYAHNRKVLHRDLKPGNIMLGKYGETLVVDWGLAKATADESKLPTEATEQPIIPKSGSTAAPTLAGSTIGTPEYMSPEQAEGRVDELGPLTDVYSLGATLYCVLTGDPPVEGNSSSEKMRKVREGVIRRPREIQHDVPRPLEAICLKAMQLKPQDRYRSASELAEDIERWLADESVSAYREPWLTSAMRFFRRNRAAAMTMAAAGLVAIAGLIGMNLVSQAKNRVIGARNLEIQRTNDQLNRKNQQLVESNEIIQQNFQAFRSLTAQLIAKSEQELSQKPGMETLRNWLADTAVGVYRKYLKNQPDELLDEDPRTLISLATFIRIAANNRRSVGNLGEALDIYQEGLEIFEGLIAERPDDATTRGNMSEFLRDHATTLRVHGDLLDAEETVNRAFGISEEMLTKYQDSVNCQKLHAQSNWERSSLALEQDDTELALNYASTGADLMAPVIDGGHAGTTDEPALLFMLLTAASASRQLDQLDEATVFIDRAQARLDQREQPEDAQTEVNDTGAGADQQTSARFQRHTRARVILERVKILEAANDTSTDTAVLLSKAIETWEGLFKDFEDFHTYGNYLVQSRLENAKIMVRKNVAEEAESEIATAVRIATELANKHPSIPPLLLLLADSLKQEALFEIDRGQDDQAREKLSEALVAIEKARLLAPTSRRTANRLAAAQAILSQIKE